MRITESERATILQALAKVDKDAPVYLFGSRVDDSARGGDIDLLVLSKKIDLLAKLDILGELHDRLGDQKIDLAILPDAQSPFARAALERASPL